MRIGLTQRQLDCLDYLRAYQAEQQMAPTVRDVMVAIGLKSAGTTLLILRALEERGHIRRLAGKARAIEIIEHRCPNCGHHLNSSAVSKPAVEAPGDSAHPPMPVAGGII